MESVAGARTFGVPGAAYDAFMGRYSLPLSAPFADLAGVAPGARVLDVGCGPGALTGELVSRLGAEHVSACDPSPPFVAACSSRHPGVEVLQGSAEQLPFTDASFDIVMSQLVLHFVSDPTRAAAEMTRVVRPGGTIAACVWDFGHGMAMLREFWGAALSLNPQAPAESAVLRFGQAGELSDWLTEAGLHEVTESTIAVSTTYSGFDELWTGFLAGIGPAGSYCVALPEDEREALRQALDERMGRRREPFTLDAVARAGRAVRA